MRAPPAIAACQRGIEQEGPVVIDAHQHGFMAQLQRRDMDGARWRAWPASAMQRHRQRRQLVGAGAQHVVGHRAGIERVEEVRPAPHPAGSSARASAMRSRRVLGLFGLGGTDGGHHGHGSLAGKRGDLSIAIITAGDRRAARQAQRDAMSGKQCGACAWRTAAWTGRQCRRRRQGWRPATQHRAARRPAWPRRRSQRQRARQRR